MENITALQGAVLSDKVYNDLSSYVDTDKTISDGFGNSYYVKAFYENPTTNLQIALYKNTETGNYVIAFRGTEPLTYGDWDTNVRMFVSTLVDTLPTTFGEALQVIDPMIEKYGLNSGNTSIVGHSMGGSLAQYFGASTGFETLTYNAYGVSGMDMVPSSSGENITNYITMHDFVSTLLGSEMLGKTYMLQDETLLSVGGHGITNFTSEENWVRGYTLVDDPQDIDAIIGTSLYELALMAIEGRAFAMINGSMDDLILGGEKYNLLIGGSGKDTLYGMGGSDNLQGGKGDDTLYGGNEDEDYNPDVFYGGEGYDTYIAGDNDIIMDEDGEGRVIFEDARLTGGKREGGGSCDTPDGTGDSSNDSDKPVEYKGDGGVYTLEKGVLTFTKSSGEVLVIDNFKNGDLGITLKSDENDPCPEPTPPTPPSPGTPAPSWPYQHGSPLVLDLNNDGTTSTFIYKTSTYFDLDNDGLRERTGWVQSGDGLLTLDKNNDGIIDNGNELFGNYTKDSLGKYANNGFDALTKYDDNHDGMINSSDNVYKALKVWQDSNSDGITDDGELKTLNELGISSINLSYVTADALEERNSIRETSTFTTQSTDANGNVTTQVSVINDVWFDRDVKDTKATIDYTQISDEIKSLGNISGSGDVEDLAIAMSKDSVLVAKVEALIDAMQNGESLDKLEGLTKDIIIRWTGTEKVTGINDYMSAACSFIAVTNQDVAIVEKFNGEGFYTNVDGTMKRGVLGAEAHFYIRDMNEYMIDKTLMSIYANKVFGDSVIDEDGYVVLSELKNAIQQALSEDNIDTAKLDAITNIAQIWNEMLGENASMSFIEELGITKEGYPDQYALLEKAYTNNHGGDADNTMIDNNSLNGLSGENSILYGQGGNDKIYGGTGHDELYGGDGDDYIDGGWGMDILNGGDGNDTLVGGDGQGNDVIIGGRGNDIITMTGYGSQTDTIIYQYGDGYDTIIGQSGGCLILRDIRHEDIRVFYVGNDMIIEILDPINQNKVNGSITIEEQLYHNVIKEFVFDNITLNIEQLKVLANDFIVDDIYIFGFTSGIQTIKDYGSISGDILQFGEGITTDNIIVKVSPNSNDLIVAIKEDEKTFDQLSNKLTITNWFIIENRIETFVFNDGTQWDINAILDHQGTNGNDVTRFIDTKNDVALNMNAGNDEINTGSGLDTIDAGSGDDIIKTGSGNDVLFGGFGNDTLNGEEGNDTINGGEGNDILNGGKGNDIYVFAKGYGIDIISDVLGIDTIKFATNIMPEDIIIKVSSSDNGIIMAIKEDGKTFDELTDKIIIKNWFDENNRVENIEFSDGTIMWNVNDILSTQATNGDDIILSIDVNLPTNINLLDGNDVVVSGNADDIINGNIGNDTLSGGGGNDTYIFNRGDGQDNISDIGTYKLYYSNYTQLVNGGADTIQFGEGITAEDIIVKASQNNNDLIIAIKEDGKTFDELTDKITIKNWFTGDYRIETITFSDGTIWNVNDIVNAQGTEYADTVHLLNNTDDINLNLQGGNDNITTSKGNDTINTGSGDDIVFAYEGNDIINGGEGNDTIKAGSGDDVLFGGLGDDTLSGENGNDTIYGDEGNDIIKAGSGDDVLLGGLGNDTLSSEDGNDTLDSGVGNDILNGGKGNDIYIFTKGDGADILTDISGNDALQFGEGITVDDIIVKASQNSNDIIIAIKEDGKTFDELTDKITIKNWFNEDYRVENITFSDGTIWNVNDIVNAQGTEYADTVRLLNNTDDVNLNLQGGNDNITTASGNDTINAGSGDDTVNAQDGNDTIDGGEGNDTIKAGSGDDVLFGGLGDDTLSGEDGNDTLNSGKGNDKLYGGYGDDAYLFDRGDGIDTLLDYSGDDTIQFGEGITVDDIVVRASHDNNYNMNDLVIAIKEDGKTFDELSDKIIIQNWYLEEERIETFIFSDGTKLDIQEIIGLQIVNDDDNYLRYLNGDDVVKGEGRDDTIHTQEGNDTISGGTGNDNIYDYDGNDTYLFDRGDGIDHIFDNGGVNKLVFGDGITLDEIEIHIDKNYLIVAIKEDGKTFDELSDKMYFNRLTGSNHVLDSIIFSDGSSIDPYTLLSSYDGTDGNDIINLTYLQSINPSISIDDSLIINAKNGKDIVTLGDGANIIDMGNGYYEVLTVGNGNNQINMGTGYSDTLIAGDGNNVVDASQSETTMNLGDGANNIVTGNRTKISLGNGSNTIEATGYKTNINAGDGDNILNVNNDGFRNIDAIFGDGNNTIIDNINVADRGEWGDGANYNIKLGSGNNIVLIGESSSKLSGEYEIYRNINITAGDGINQILINNGDDNLTINAGLGNNNIGFSADVDNVSIYASDGNNTIAQLEDGDIENSYYEWIYDEDTGEEYQSDELVLVSDPNDINIMIGNGVNTVTLTDIAQDYKMTLGDGDNIVTIGKEGSDNNYAMNSGIVAGNGANNISILNGDGELYIGSGNGKNSIVFSGDVDSVNIEIGDGDNIINQIPTIDTDSSSSTTIPEEYYITHDIEPTSTETSNEMNNENNQVAVAIGLGANNIILGASDDSVYFSEDAYEQLSYGANSKVNTLDVGTGSNYINLVSNANQNITIGAENYDSLSTYAGYDYTEIYLGDGNNTIDIKGADELYADLGNGNNNIAINNTNMSYIGFTGGENTISIKNTDNSYVEISSSNASSNTTSVTIKEGSTLLVANDSTSNIITMGNGSDDIFTYNSDDTYIVKAGNGSDAILDMQGVDKIVFGEGISKDSIKVWIEFNGLENHTDNAELIENYDYEVSTDNLSASLIIQYTDNPDDVLILLNWYSTDSRIEQFEFSDGSILNDHQIVSLIGTSESDIIIGTDGDNTLQGGPGADTISGEAGNDTYIFNRSDSYDTIDENGGFDTISFGNNITKDDLILQKVDNNLLISLKEDGKTINELTDTITINNWFDASGRIEQFTFEDGSLMNLGEMLGLVDTDGIIYYGTPETDTMEGTDFSDVIMARESDDNINGNDGDDLLFGEAGNDTLNGGAGNDLLYGGEGNDIYIVDKNMGDDIIFDQSGNDTIQFAQGITSNDIMVSYAKNDLNISLDGTNIIITDWYNKGNRIETLLFSDGETLDINAIINLQYGDVKGVVEGTVFDINDGNDTAYLGQNGNDIFYVETNSGNNTIVDSGGHDTIVFADGITPEMLSLSYNGNDLIVSFEETTLCISGWYTTQNRIETFEFENGIKLNVQNIIDLMSTDGDDAIRSLEEGSIVDGGEGNDTIQGGSGRDTLLGGNGSDTYLFGYGSGHDVIFDVGGSSSEIDSVVFDTNIKPENVIFQWEQSTDNLIIYLIDPNNPTILDAVEDRITIQDWYKSDNRIESFVFADGTTIDAQGVIEKLATDENDLVRGVDDSDTVIDALDGNDEVYTYSGNDILIGGKENDLLAGQQGDDVYIFNRGDGVDTIIDRATHIWDERNEDDSGNDKIVFGEGITIDDISVSWDKDTNDLIIGITDPQNPNVAFDELSDKIIIREWFNPSSRIESISFADGSTIGTSEIYNLLATDSDDDIRALDEGGVLNGYDGNDILGGSIGDDILIGGNGNDTLLGNIGDDILIGSNGDDLLQGEDGNDILDGGEGDNILQGGSGNDAYVFGYESGKITVYDSAYILDTASTREDDYVAIDGGVDTVYFGKGITINDLIVSNDGYDLIITLKNSTDSELRIQDYYKSFNTIESFGFSDGSIVESSEIEALLFTPNNDNVTFVDDRDRIINGNDGDDIINGGSGNDTIDGAGGNDTLNGGFGNDTYIFGRGSGHDTIIDDGIGEWWQTQSGSDNILFKDGITNDDLWTKRDGNDIIIGIKEDGKSFDELNDTLRIVGAFNEANPFESLSFENGETLAIESIAHTAPVATDDTIQAVEDIPFISTVSLVANDSDIDGDNLSIVAGIFTTTQGGSIDIKADGSYTYTPSTNFNGVDTFEYTLTDGELTDTATLTLNVQAVNDAPVAQNAIATVDEDTVLNGILPIASDVDGDSLTYTLDIDSSHGKVIINSNGSYSYTPNSNYYGTDSFVYLVSDGNGGQTTATMDLTINSIIDDMTIYGTRKNDTLRGNQIDVGSNDTIYGLNGNDTIYGLGGNDIIDGGNGSDNVYGGDGDDTIYASLGRDYLDGGNGIDTISYANYTHGVVETLNSNTFISYILGNARNTSFENLEGSNYSDILTGDSQNNTIYGLNGNDTLNGGKGNDTLIGGKGKDILYGGAGNDIFVIDNLNKSDIDSILDFSSKDDTIYLDNSIFASLIDEGTLDNSNFVSNKSGNAIDGDDYIVYETDTGKLFYDADGNGNGAAIQIATLYGLSNQNTLTYSDFTII